MGPREKQTGNQDSGREEKKKGAQNGQNPIDEEHSYIKFYEGPSICSSPGHKVQHLNFSLFIIKV